MLTKYIFKKEIVKALWWFLGSIGFIWLLSQEIQFLISETDSLPQHYFIHFRRITPKINNYTIVWSDWYQNKIIKKIIGLSGDKIWLNNNEILVNDFKVGACKTIATDKRVLHPIKAQIIPKGMVFLYGTHERSFDSRYQELGLVPINQLGGLVVPLI